MDAGETFFRSGDAVRRLYRVADGIIALVRPLPHGADLTIQRTRPSDLIAEASLFADAYHCDAVARGVARVQGVAVARVNDLIERRPELARGVGRTPGAGEVRISRGCRRQWRWRSTRA
ncbi:cyclic nucleotide-binding domain-containing protein [Bosea sp. (in: a-proteobacteria)]|uniref:Crp/Fnr family transcriptional regulator n=1 Tax=Bosea TaxID=85413 RepID=UPI0009E97EBA